MEDAYTSPVLYHLVGGYDPTAHEDNFDILCKVLESMEVRARKVAGHDSATVSINSGRGCINGEPADQTACCFCDIPFTALGRHTRRYGFFGVGVDRDMFGQHGGRPVIYIPVVSDNNPGLNNYVCVEATNAWQGLEAHFPSAKSSRIVGAAPATAQESVTIARSFLSREVIAFLKEFDLALPREHPDNYYMEREWRKLTKFALHLSLREIIAPAAYHARIRGRFPNLAAVPINAIQLTPPGSNRDFR